MAGFKNYKEILRCSALGVSAQNDEGSKGKA
jgi:hypothetical protein